MKLPYIWIILCRYFFRILACYSNGKDNCEGVSGGSSIPRRHKKMAQHFIPTFSSPFITTTSSYNPSSHPTNQPLFLYVYLTDRVQGLSYGLQTEYLPFCSVHMAHLRVSTKGLNTVACRQLPEIKFQKTQPESDCQGERFNKKSAMCD